MAAVEVVLACIGGTVVIWAVLYVIIATIITLRWK